MNNNEDIPTTDTTEIKQLINRVKQVEFDQDDAQLVEKLLNFLLIVQIGPDGIQASFHFRASVWPGAVDHFQRLGARIGISREA
jgi:hypothetical protein